MGERTATTTMGKPRRSPMKHGWSMGERTATTTMGKPRRSPMKHGWSMGERAEHHGPTIDRVLAKKVNQHG